MSFLNPAFVLAAILSIFMGYLALTDTNVRQQFVMLATSSMTGFFGLSTPQKSTESKEEKDV